MAYRLALPPGLSSVHLVLYVLLLKKHFYDLIQVTDRQGSKFDDILSYKEGHVVIANRQVHKLQNKEIASIKVTWSNI